MTDPNVCGACLPSYDGVPGESNNPCVPTPDPSISVLNENIILHVRPRFVFVCLLKIPSIV
jgi:hypothetical protein